MRGILSSRLSEVGPGLDTGNDVLDNPGWRSHISQLHCGQLGCVLCIPVDVQEMAEVDVSRRVATASSMTPANTIDCYTRNAVPR